jgi:hypothetical protein
MGKWQFPTFGAWWWLCGMARGWLHASNVGALLILYTNGLILPEWDLFVPPMVEQSIQITHSNGEMAVSHLWSMVVAVWNGERVPVCVQWWCYVVFVYQWTHLTPMRPISPPPWWSNPSAYSPILMGKSQFTTFGACWWLCGMARGWLHASNGGAMLILYTNGTY